MNITVLSSGVIYQTNIFLLRPRDKVLGADYKILREDAEIVEHIISKINTDSMLVIVKLILFLKVFYNTDCTYLLEQYEDDNET